MPPSLLFDPQKYDQSKTAITREQIYDLLPHRHEFMQLDGVHAYDVETHEIMAYRDVREGEWWARGHIPGRPIFPGVLMIETVAHVASVFYAFYVPNTRFMAFAGVEGVKFRGAVYPPSRVLILGYAVEAKRRRMILDTQALVDGNIVFEGRIIGMLMDAPESS